MRLTTNQNYCDDCDFGREKECFFNDKEKFNCKDKQIYEKLREYEDLEEQGLLVRLPCKVGNRTYQIVTKSERINNGGCTCCTTAFGSDCNCDYYIEDDEECINLTGNKSYQIISRGFQIKDFYDFGKTVFLTKEEAEQKLKEMEREDK